MVVEREWISTGSSRPSSQHNEDLLVPEGQRLEIMNKDRRQKKREKGKGIRQRG